MATTTKKDLIERTADATRQHRVVVKRTIQTFLDLIIHELSRGNRLELREFGVFEAHVRPPRIGRNPLTKEEVPVPSTTTVRFKSGRLMRTAVTHSATRKRAREQAAMSERAGGAAERADAARRPR
jgi:integration host factor subunit beta